MTEGLQLWTCHVHENMDLPRDFFRSDQLTCNRSVYVNVWKFSRETKAFEIAKVNSRCFCWFPAAMLVPLRRNTNMASHIKLCNFPRYMFSNNSIMRYRTTLCLSHVVYVSLFYNISISWLYLWNFWGFYFFTCVTMCEVKITNSLSSRQQYQAQAAQALAVSDDHLA